jgi:putative tryptophan/tyrosine transport system substrate-binding protein
MRQCCKAIVNNSLIERRGSPSGDGASIVDTYRHFGLYAGPVLDGAKPAGLPIDQPTKFELVLNLKATKAPRRRNCADVVARADEAIEMM